MTVEDLALLVAEMRSAQQKYFRSLDAIEQAKRLEKKVDRCVAIVLDKQKGLFDE